MLSIDEWIRVFIIVTENTRQKGNDEEKVENSGGVFMGEHSFEVLGDYLAGPSHVMPTGGSARFASPLTVWDFVKIISLIALDESTAQAISKYAGQSCHNEKIHT